MTTQIGQGWLVSPGWGFGIAIVPPVIQYLVVGGGGGDWVLRGYLRWPYTVIER